jgi:protein-S-isoprenylcysteine O-methyltransferase Ste14
MYVSLAALYAGLALLYDSWWLLLFLIPVLLVIRYAVIAREEKYLTGAFPVEYSAYCSHVRRWL